MIHQYSGIHSRKNNYHLNRQGFTGPTSINRVSDNNAEPASSELIKESKAPASLKLLTLLSPMVLSAGFFGCQAVSRRPNELPETALPDNGQIEQLSESSASKEILLKPLNPASQAVNVAMPSTFSQDICVFQPSATMPYGYAEPVPNSDLTPIPLANAIDPRIQSCKDNGGDYFDQFQQGNQLFFREVIASPPVANTPICDTPELTIMPLGDSITHGSAIEGGYRIHLWNKFLEEGRKVDFVGSQSNGPSNIDQDHEGHPGEAISFIQGEIDTWLSNSTPQVILMMIGTNDVLYPEAHDFTTASARLTGLIQQIVDKSPDTELFIASIPPLTDPEANERAQLINAALPTIIATFQQQGKRVHYVDTQSILTTQDLADGVHPNNAGYEKLADSWYDAILKTIREKC